MAKSFEVTTSNVKSRIDSVSFDSATGKVSVKVSIWERKMNPVQLILAQYLLSGGSWIDLTLSSGSIQKNVNINNSGRWQQQTLIWDAFEDVDLISYNDVQIKLQFKDSDGTNDDEIVSSLFDFDLSPSVSRVVDPINFGKDTTPEFLFEVPTTFSPANMHFELKIADDEDLTQNVTTVDSSLDQTGWEFEIEEIYVNMLSEGCPDASALDQGARVKHTLQNALNKDTYYFAITPKSVNKKDPTSEISLTPVQMTGYTINY